MESAIETNTNDEIQVLHVKLEVVEKELQLAIDRAEKAESELEQFKKLYNIGDSNDDSGRCRSCGTALPATSAADDPNRIVQVPAAPPPPPPPMPKFNLAPTNFTPLRTTATTSTSSLSDGIAAITLNHTRNDDNQQVKNATGRHIYI